MTIAHRIGSLPKIALNTGFGGMPFDWWAPGTVAETGAANPLRMTDREMQGRGASCRSGHDHGVPHAERFHELGERVRLQLRRRMLGQLRPEVAEPRWNQQPSLLVPTIVVSGVLFWRRTAIGYVAAGIVSVMGSLVLLNLLLASAFQTSAGVAGVNAFPPEGVAMTVGMVASAVLLLGRSTKRTGGNKR